MASITADLARTFFDPRVYAEATAQKRRRTVKMLSLLTLIATLTATLSLTLWLRGVIAEIKPIVDQVPSVVIRNGKATADVPQPWIRTIAKTSEGHDLVVIIDTTGRWTDFLPDQAGVFLAQSKLMLRGDEGETESIDLSALPDFELGPQVVHKWLWRVQWMAPPIFAVVLFVLFASFKLQQALLLVLVGLAAASGRRRSLSFRALFAVSVYALGPAVVIDCALQALPFGMPLRIPLYFLVAALTTYVAVRRLPEAD